MIIRLRLCCGRALAVGIFVTAQINHIAKVSVAESMSADVIVPTGVVDGKTLHRAVVDAVSSAENRHIVKIVRVAGMKGTPVVKMAAFGNVFEITNLRVGHVHPIVDNGVLIIGASVVSEAFVG